MGNRKKSTDPQYREKQEALQKEIVELPEAPFADLDPETQAWKIMMLRVKGYDIAEIAKKLNTTDSTVRKIYSAMSERMIAETDDMRKSLLATNILRLEHIIRKTMEMFDDRFDRDVAAILMNAIKLEVQIQKEQAPVVINQQNVLVQHTPTMSSASPLYQKTLAEMNPDTIRHEYPDIYAKHQRILEDPRVKKLGTLLEDTIDDTETTEGI